MKAIEEWRTMSEQYPRYQKDWTVGGEMFHVRENDWEVFKEAVANMETMLPQHKSFPDDSGNMATPPDKVVPAPPTCGIHGTPMILKPAGVSKSTGKPYPAFWSCGQKNANGTYCQYRPKQ